MDEKDGAGVQYCITPTELEAVFAEWERFGIPGLTNAEKFVEILMDYRQNLPRE